jgi:hypothetical protein
MGEVEPRFFDMRRSAEDLSAAVGTLSHPTALVDLSWLREGALPEEAEALSLIAETAAALPSGTKAASLAPGPSLASVLGTAPEESATVLQGSQTEQLSSWNIEEVPERPLAEAAGQKISCAPFCLRPVRKEAPEGRQSSVPSGPSARASRATGSMTRTCRTTLSQSSSSRVQARLSAGSRSPNIRHPRISIPSLPMSGCSMCSRSHPGS